MANTCDHSQILLDVHSLQSAFNEASRLNIPADIVASAKDTLQDFIGNDPFLKGEARHVDAETLARIDSIEKSTAAVLEKIDNDVELRGLSLEDHHKLIAPIAKAQRIAHDLRGAASQCQLFKVPLQFSSFI